MPTLPPMLARSGLALLIVLSPCDAGHYRPPESPPASPPAAAEQSSGEEPCARPKLCDLEHPYHWLPVFESESCELNPEMILTLSKALKQANEAERTWRNTSLGLLGALLVLMFIWLSACAIYVWRRQQMRRDRTGVLPSPRNEEKANCQQGIKVVYLRPDAWPMSVVNPGGDQCVQGWSRHDL